MGTKRKRGERERRRRELEELVAGIAAEQALTEAEIRKTQKVVRDVGRQVGELTGAWGRFSEDLLSPSIEAAVERLGVRIVDVHRRVRSRKAGQVLKEADVVIHGVHGKPERGVCFVASVKSRARIQDVDSLVRDIERFHDLYPTMCGAELAGLLAAVGFDPDVEERAARKGLHVIQTGKRIAQVRKRPGFTPRIWPAAC